MEALITLFLIIWLASGVIAWLHNMVLRDLFRTGGKFDFFMIIPCAFLGSITAIICLVADIQDNRQKMS
jgi:hypothetical protein